MSEACHPTKHETSMLYNSKPKKKTEIKKKTPRKRTPSIKSLRDKLDIVFSKYIRLRDSRNFGYFQFVCISCGEKKQYRQMDCGPFQSRRIMSTRWDEENCNGQCRHCNRFEQGNLLGYRDNLINKLGYKEYQRLGLNIADIEKRYYKVRELGNAKVEALGRRANMTKKWSAPELQELIRYYECLVKAFESERF